MAKRKTGSKPREKSSAGGEMSWGRYVSAGALIAGVLIVILLGAVLQADGEAGSGRVDTAAPVHPELGGDLDDGIAEPTSIEPAEQPQTPVTGEATGRDGADPGRGSEDPFDRALRDRRRLDAAGAGWTLQFGAFREAGPVSDLLRTLASRDELYIVREGGQFKIWWGHHPTRDRAVAQRGIPAELTALSDSPFPKRVGGSAG